MDVDGPEILFYVLWAAATFAWLWALKAMLEVTRVARGADNGEELERLGMTTPGNVLAGTTEVTGNAAALSARAATLLAKQGSALLGPVKILERTNTQVTFESLGQPLNAPQTGELFRRGELRFSPAGDKTRIDYAIEVPSRSGILLMGWVFIVLGLGAIIFAVALILTTVLPSPDAGVRWQAVQMVQTVHFLWPPFLCMALYRRSRRHVRASIESLVHNLPFLDD